MYEKAEQYVKENTRPAFTYEEFKSLMADKGGYVKMMWCGNQACEDQIKEETTATARCIPFHQEHLTDTCPVCGKKAKMLIYFAKAY